MLASVGRAEKDKQPMITLSMIPLTLINLWGSGWLTSLRRWYTMLALPLSGFESRQQQRKKDIGKTPAQNVPQ